ncbi:MAG: sorbosone dehydrogenase family protein, partial [Pyrinomonadaceae bacterium]|nr:sorbosone dehydrogenase family protein [Pyrinomonadaceae bacterium]
DLPKPYESESASRSSSLVPQPKNAELKMPNGFRINQFAENFSQPRVMALAPNGDVFVADSVADKIIVLRDKNKDGKSDERFTFADGLNQPFGMAFQNGFLYVANTDTVVRFVYQNGQTKSAAEPEKIIDLPIEGYNQHWTRNITFSPDGSKLYVSVGSQSNADIEPTGRAAISEYDADGKNGRIYASGLRNPVGIAFNQTTKVLYTTVNERDGLGDDLVPDYLTSVKENGFYGFPYSYLGQNIDPRRAKDVKGDVPDLVKNSIVPEVLFQSHSAALGLLFYNGKAFPAEYQGDAFVAMHGSWNREKLTGYKIVRIRFKDGKPLENAYEDFVSGWLPDENSNKVWGRPVGLLVAADGSLLITDDGAKKIWRVSHNNKN